MTLVADTSENIYK